MPIPFTLQSLNTVGAQAQGTSQPPAAPPAPVVQAPEPEPPPPPREPTERLASLLDKSYSAQSKKPGA